MDIADANHIPKEQTVSKFLKEVDEQYDRKLRFESKAFEKRNDIQSLNSHINYNYSQTGNILKINGFTVTNILKIQSMNLNDTSIWIDTAIAAGANTVNGIDYGISEQKLNSTKNQLIKDAIANAKQKASIASSAVGLNIIGIRSMAIDTGDPIPPQPFSNEFSAKSVLSNAHSTPVMPGESDVSVLVHIVYSLG